VKETTVTRLQERSQLATTMINLFELYLGAYKSRDVEHSLTSVKGLFSTLQVLPLTEKAAERAARILAELEAKGQPIDARDLFVGAIALEEGFAVLTQNIEHFARIRDLEVITEKQALSQQR